MKMQTFLFNTLECDKLFGHSMAVLDDNCDYHGDLTAIV